MTQTRRPRLRPRQRRLERSTHRVLHALLELYQQLHMPRPLDDLLQSILDTAVACVPGAQRGSLMVLEGEQLLFRATVGYSLHALRPARFPVTMIDHFLGEGQVVQVNDFANWDAVNLPPEVDSILREHGAIAQIRRSVVGKIMVNGRFYGTLVLDNLRTHAPFPAAAETLTLLFAEQAGALLEQALLLEQLRQADTQLIESERLAGLGRFIASIAHEINNPLTAVLGYADFLAACDLPAEPAALLGQLRHGAERVRTIVRNLQLLARQQHAGASQVSLNMLAEQTLLLKRGELSLDQIEVELRLDPELPFTWADGGQLSQVLLNLLTNAQHALQSRALPRRLGVATALVAGAGGPELQLQVTDNGVGMEAAVQARIFEPFFSTKPAGQGTGLGLSICHTIVAAHGGAIAVSSAPGAGAAFSVCLPLRVGPEQAVADAEPPPGPSQPVGLRVLLVDDDPLVAEVVLRALGGANSVSVAADGVEALRLVAAHRFDLVLSDLRMPVMDGLELHDRLLDERPELVARLLFLSGDVSGQATREGLRATGRPLLHKPFRPEELYAAIAALRSKAS